MFKSTGIKSEIVLFTVNSLSGLMSVCEVPVAVTLFYLNLIGPELG